MLVCCRKNLTKNNYWWLLCSQGVALFWQKRARAHCLRETGNWPLRLPSRHTMFDKKTSSRMKKRKTQLLAALAHTNPCPCLWAWEVRESVTLERDDDGRNSRLAYQLRSSLIRSSNAGNPALWRRDQQWRWNGPNFRRDGNHNAIGPGVGCYPAILPRSERQFFQLCQPLDRRHGRDRITDKLGAWWHWQRRRWRL